MKGVSGVIGGVVVIILLLVAVSLTLAAMNYAYGFQQIEAKTIMSQLSQPHVAQVTPDSVMVSGRLVASYIIYPDGRVAFLNETVSGIKSFQSYLDGNPWAIVVFSNGQWINVSGAESYADYNGFGILGTGSYLVPYYGSIFPWNQSALKSFLTSSLGYTYPLYSPITVNETYDGSYEGYVTINPSDPLVFGLGRILTVPVTSESGWLNFTITDVPALGDSGQPVSFAIIVQNASGPLLDIIYFTFYYQQVVTGWHKVSPGVWEGTISGWAYNFTYGIYQVWTNPSYFAPPPGYDLTRYPYFMYVNLSYSFSNKTTNGDWLLERLTGTTFFQLQYDPIIKVAVRFTPGEPAEMYLWIGNYNGSGISWYKVILPTSEAPVSSKANVNQVFISSGAGLAPIGMYYTVSWPNVTCSWPVNLYTEAPSNNVYYSSVNWPESIYLEPLVPRPGSTIEVVPYTFSPLTEGTVIVNVAYTI